MEKDDRRRKVHPRDKRKYKEKSKYSKSKLTLLTSNSDRYEECSDEQEFHLDSGTDYALLAEAPIGKGLHFQFKSDKNIAEETANKISLFSLNLNQLQYSILTLPFYKRIGIDSAYFTENQLKFMEKDADINLTKYKDFCSNQEAKTNVTEVKDNTKQEITGNKDREEQEEPPSLHYLQSTERKENNDLVITKNKSDDDLEKWLDDILDS